MSFFVNFRDVHDVPGDPAALPGYFSDEEEWPEEERRLYEDQVHSSAGFDVEPVSADGGVFGLIHPMDIDEEDAFIDLKSAAALAIEEYNHRYEDCKGELQFVKVVKCTRQLCGFMNYFLTFEAKDLSNGEVGTYQAAIFQDIKSKMHVLSFRLKPSDGEDRSGDAQKKWFWHD